MGKGQVTALISTTEVGAGAGLVKYDLVAREFVDDRGIRDQTRNVDNKVLGVFLAQVLEEKTIKVEVVPGRSSAQVAGFSPEARLYHR